MISFTKKQSETVTFKTAQEAYCYLFLKLQEKGIDIEEASNRAFKFSEEYASRMNIPTSIQIEEKGFKGVLQKVKMANDFLKENPSILELGKPILATVLSAFGGAFAGSTLANSQDAEPLPIAPIEYDDDEIKTTENK